jgi:hypothetical protein
MPITVSKTETVVCLDGATIWIDKRYETLQRAVQLIAQRSPEVLTDLPDLILMVKHPEGHTEVIG